MGHPLESVGIVRVAPQPLVQLVQHVEHALQGTHVIPVVRQVHGEVAVRQLVEVERPFARDPPVQRHHDPVRVGAVEVLLEPHHLLRAHLVVRAPPHRLGLDPHVRVARPLDPDVARMPEATFGGPGPSPSAPRIRPGSEGPPPASHAARSPPRAPSPSSTPRSGCSRPS